MNDEIFCNAIYELSQDRSALEVVLQETKPEPEDSPTFEHLIQISKLLRNFQADRLPLVAARVNQILDATNKSMSLLDIFMTLECVQYVNLQINMCCEIMNLSGLVTRFVRSEVSHSIISMKLSSWIVIIAKIYKFLAIILVNIHIHHRLLESRLRSAVTTYPWHHDFINHELSLLTLSSEYKKILDAVLHHRQLQQWCTGLSNVDELPQPLRIVIDENDSLPAHPPPPDEDHIDGFTSPHSPSSSSSSSSSSVTVSSLSLSPTSSIASKSQAYSEDQHHGVSTDIMIDLTEDDTSSSHSHQNHLSNQELTKERTDDSNNNRIRISSSEDIDLAAISDTHDSSNGDGCTDNDTIAPPPTIPDSKVHNNSSSSNYSVKFVSTAPRSRYHYNMATAAASTRNTPLPSPLLTSSISPPPPTTSNGIDAIMLLAAVASEAKPIPVTNAASDLSIHSQNALSKDATFTSTSYYSTTESPPFLLLPSSASSDFIMMEFQQRIHQQQLQEQQKQQQLQQQLRALRQQQLTNTLLQTTSLHHIHSQSQSQPQQPQPQPQYQHRNDMGTVNQEGKKRKLHHIIDQPLQQSQLHEIHPISSYKNRHPTTHFTTTPPSSSTASTYDAHTKAIARAIQNKYINATSSTSTTSSTYPSTALLNSSSLSTTTTTKRKRYHVRTTSGTSTGKSELNKPSSSSSVIINNDNGRSEQRIMTDDYSSLSVSGSTSIATTATTTTPFVSSVS